MRIIHAAADPHMVGALVWLKEYNKQWMEYDAVCGSVVVDVYFCGYCRAKTITTIRTIVTHAVECTIRS